MFTFLKAIVIISMHGIQDKFGLAPASETTADKKSTKINNQKKKNTESEMIYGRRD